MANVTRSPFVQAGDGALLRFLLDARFAPGSAFFVQSTHSGAGDTPGRGQTPDAPLATIDYAIGLCTRLVVLTTSRGGVIKNATTDSTNLVIADNLIQDLTASNTKSIVLTATSTGQISGNRMQILSG